MFAYWFAQFQEFCIIKDELWIGNIFNNSIDLYTCKSSKYIIIIIIVVLCQQKHQLSAGQAMCCPLSCL